MVDNNKIEDLKFNIERANEIVRLYENRRRVFLEINLALITAFSIIFGFLFNVFNILGKIFISISICIYFIITLRNISYNLKENITKGINPAICSYTRNFNITKIENFKEFPFEKDYETQLKNLHKYQENYDRIAKKTRDITFKGLKILLILLIISIIINTVGIWQDNI